MSPQQNKTRSIIDLSGIWDIKPDAEGLGEQNSWHKGFEGGYKIAVPGSWNEQLMEMGLMNYMGTMWYQTEFILPAQLDNRILILRFDSIDYLAKIWLNGHLVGENSGGYLPVEFAIDEFMNTDGMNTLIVSVNNTLNHEMIPPGVTSKDYAVFNKEREESFPPTVFDFFTFGGIQRPVRILSLNINYLDTIELDTFIKGTKGEVKYLVNYTKELSSTFVKVSVFDGKDLLLENVVKSDSSSFQNSLTIDNCEFWTPETPKLYTIVFDLYDDKFLLDSYSLKFGVREIKVSGSQILLNGKPIFLKGFGKHEDFPVIGKGLSHPLIIKDFYMMKWIGANSFRTAHYPYSEDIMYLADEMGFLIIDETPAVSLNFRFVNEETKKFHKKELEKLIRRDHNHPSVIAWSIGNEPGIWQEEEALGDIAVNYWKDINNYVKSMDPSRPTMLPNCYQVGKADPTFDFIDIIALNRYKGWYDVPGDLQRAKQELLLELDEIYEKYKKPMMFTEFGADTVEGMHSTFPQLFTEEYQSDLLAMYFEVVEEREYMVGEHIWNFADFRTAQQHRRVGMNRKGVFTRQREPKLAAFTVRNHWLKSDK